MLLPEACTASLRADVDPAASARRAMRAADTHVLAAPVFRAAVLRERKRADRSRQSWSLLLVRVPRPARHDGTAASAAVVASMTAARRDMDLVGWARADALGLLMPGTGATAATRVQARLRRELAARMAEPPTAISLRVHPNPGVAGEGDASDGWLDRGDDRRRRVTRDATKRAVDVVAALSLLLALSPLLLLVAIVVKATSRGPVLYRQERVGWRQRPFRMLKFRTMYVHADARIHREFVTRFISALPPVNGSGASTVFKLTADPRITRAGRLLRKTSLDELPQLWNVIRGDMSLVGPRPPLPYELDHYEAWHRRRILEAKPGLTGLWQVTGRSRTTFDEMVRLDLRYARTRSFWLDIKILLATPGAVLSGKGAC